MDTSTRSFIKSSYDRLLAENNILYMPSCLIVEMMTKLYSEMTLVNLSGKLHNLVPDLLILLKRLSRDLKVTADAYRETRIRFFIGNWREDKIRARKLFFNLMSRLGYLSRMIDNIDKRLIFHAIDDLSNSWTNLDHLLEDQLTDPTSTPLSRETRDFRQKSPDHWCAAMAEIILDLDATLPAREANTYLILLCYRHVKNAVLHAIEQQQRKRSLNLRFDPGRILCVSNEDLPITCPTCALMTDALRSRGDDLIPKTYSSHSRRQSRDTVFLDRRPMATEPLPIH